MERSEARAAAHKIASQNLDKFTALTEAQYQAERENAYDGLSAIDELDDGHQRSEVYTQQIKAAFYGALQDEATVIPAEYQDLSLPDLADIADLLPSVTRDVREELRRRPPTDDTSGDEFQGS